MRDAMAKHFSPAIGKAPVQPENSCRSCQALFSQQFESQNNFQRELEETAVVFCFTFWGKECNLLSE